MAKKLTHLRGFIDTNRIRRGAFEKMIGKGGIYYIKGNWEKGDLYLNSIQNIETKEYILE